MVESPDPIDVEVGQRIRLWRKAANVTQTKLAESLGLTFQQVQKYEKGSNRVSASMLVKIAARLNTTVAALVGETDDGMFPATLLHLTAAPGAARLLQAYARLPAGSGEHVIGFLERMAVTMAPAE